MKLKCIFKHDFVRSLEFTPIFEPTDDQNVTLIRVVDTHKCSRCSKEKRSEEVVPFRYVVEDEDEENDNHV